MILPFYILLMFTSLCIIFLCQPYNAVNIILKWLPFLERDILLQSLKYLLCMVIVQENVRCAVSPLKLIASAYHLLSNHFVNEMQKMLINIHKKTFVIIKTECL